MRRLFCLIILSTAFHSNSKKTQSPEKIKGGTKLPIGLLDSIPESRSPINLKRKYKKLNRNNRLKYKNQFITKKIKHFDPQNKQEMKKSKSQRKSFTKRKRKTDSLKVLRHKKRSIKGKLKGKNKRRKKQMSAITN